MQPSLRVLHRNPDLEEIAARVDFFADLGMDRFRLRGGDPL